MKSSSKHDALQIKSMLKDVICREWRPVLAPDSIRGTDLRAGYHSHDTWEIFVVHGAPLDFEVAGHDVVSIPAGEILLVPPGCVHMQVDRTKQRKGLLLLILNLPGDEIPNGGAGSWAASGARERIELSPEARDEWSNLLGESPGSVMKRASAALAGGDWSVQRGAVLVRLIISAFGEATAGMADKEPLRRGEQRIHRVGGILRERFYDPELSLESVAGEVGLSATHLATRFKKITGQTFWKTLLEIRLRRARTLLEDERLSVKEVSVLTGWSSQLYFSAAFRRRFSVPPSEIRTASGDGGGDHAKKSSKSSRGVP